MSETKKRKQVSPTIEGSIFKFLSSVFKKHDVQAVLVGGYALIAHKVQRMTFDIDFMVTKESSIKIEQDIINAGYSVLNRRKLLFNSRAGRSDSVTSTS